MPTRLTRRELLIGGASIVGVGLAAYFGIEHLPPALAPFPTATPTPAPVGPRTFKPPLRGFLARHSVPSYDWMLGWVVTIRWTDVQANPGGALLANNPIDRAIAACNAFNASHPQADPSLERGLRLRIEPLTRPGSWPSFLGGAPITVTDPANRHSTQVGHFWTPAFVAAYMDLQSKLAAAYDSVRVLRENGLAMVELVYDEPFRRYSFPELEATGWSLSLDQAAFGAMLQAHKVWRATPQFLSFNPYAVPGGGTDESYTESVMVHFRQLFGEQAVLMNSSIRASDLSPEYDSMYAKIRSLGAPISFQTATLSRMGDPGSTFVKCVNYGASSVELPDPYSGISLTLLQTAQAQLLGNRPERPIS